MRPACETVQTAHAMFHDWLFRLEESMTMKRSGDAWMPADDYGRGMPRFSVNLLVRDVA